ALLSTRPGEHLEDRRAYHVSEEKIHDRHRDTQHATSSTYCRQNCLPLYGRDKRRRAYQSNIQQPKRRGDVQLYQRSVWLGQYLQGISSPIHTDNGKVFLLLS